jgi:hypothetical protein
MSAHANDVDTSKAPADKTKHDVGLMTPPHERSANIAADLLLPELLIGKQCQGPWSATQEARASWQIPIVTIRFYYIFATGSTVKRQKVGIALI